MPFKHDLALRNIPLSKQPFKTQPQIENEDVTWSAQYNLPASRTNTRRVLSLQEVALDGWFLIFHIVLKTCTICIIHKFNMSFIFHLYILRLTSWISTNPSTEELKFESPSKWKSYEGLNLDRWIHLLGFFCFLFLFFSFFLYYLVGYYIDSSKLLGTFPEGLDFNRLFHKLKPTGCWWR